MGIIKMYFEDHVGPLEIWLMAVITDGQWWLARSQQIR